MRPFFASLLFPLALLQGPADGLRGDWEGTLESAERLVSFTVRFAPSTDGWAGTMDVLGRTGVPLQETRLEGERLDFQVSGSAGPLVFHGQIRGDTVVGTATQAEVSYTFRLEREPELPNAANRNEAWRQDLEFAERKLLRLDRSFDATTSEQLRQRLRRLKDDASEMSDATVIVELARAVALAGNAHTRLYLLRNRTELRRLPIRVWWFADGLYVVKATPENERLVGCLVERIGPQSAEAARERLADVYAGNASWKAYMSAYLLTSPEVLQGAGLVPNMEGIAWSFRCGARVTEAVLRPLPLVRKQTPVEAWWDLAPDFGSPGLKLVGALDGRPLPLYLRQPDRNYLHHVLDGRTLYVRYNRSQEMPSLSLSTFAEQVSADTGGRPLEEIVVDVRFNTGGNLDVGRPLMERLRTLAAEKGARVFVIVGRATFSAGLYHAAQWKEWGATLVGEPPGDELDFWAEGGNVVLPNSLLTIHYANGFHAYSARAYPGVRIANDLNVRDLEPDLPVAMTCRDYGEGRDPALAAVLGRRWERRSVPPFCLSTTSRGGGAMPRGIGGPGPRETTMGSGRRREGRFTP